MSGESPSRKKKRGNRHGSNLKQPQPSSTDSSPMVKKPKSITPDKDTDISKSRSEHRYRSDSKNMPSKRRYKTETSEVESDDGEKEDNYEEEHSDEESDDEIITKDRPTRDNETYSSASLKRKHRYEEDQGDHQFRSKDALEECLQHQAAEIQSYIEENKRLQKELQMRNNNSAVIEDKKLNLSQQALLVKFIKENLFPRLKFVTKEHLVKHEEIMQQIYERVGFNTIDERAAFKNDIIKQIKYSLTQRRHYVTARVKEVVMGKFCLTH